MSERFDQRYYRKYYVDPETRVGDQSDTVRLARFVCAYLLYVQLPVKRVLDVGCGLGLWRPEVEAHFPDATYTGVEVSKYVAERFGWVHASVNDYTPRGKFDLVICQDVFQYLNNADAQDGIDRLGTWCRGLLYFGALTREDWEHNVDQSRTDGDAYLRSVKWYRRHLKRHFVPIGGSMFLHRDAPTVLFELEHGA